MNDAATVLVLGTAVPATALMVFAVICPHTNDRWMMRRRNPALISAVDKLPRDALPPFMTGVEVAHAIGTMRQRDIHTMLQNPGLEAALRGVVSDSTTTKKGKDVSTQGKDVSQGNEGRKNVGQKVLV